MDTHNTFDAPNTIHPVAFAGRNAGGKAVFDLPSKSIAVVAIQ
jgi:alpha-N-arabinofuranosidase